MPSSPAPPDYKRTLQRFFYRGLSLLPQDALPEGKSAFSRNIRAYQDGTFEPRYGLDQLTAGPVDNASPLNPIHSIFRLNDPTPFADEERRFLGVGPLLLGGTPGVDTYALVDPSSYSGDPLTGIVAHPANSPRPFLYIGDRLRMRKVNTTFNDMSIGIAQPLAPPTAALAAPQVTYLDTVGVSAWVAYGGSTAGFATVSRVATTVTQLLYDAGVTGMASVALASFNNVTAGMNIDIGASPETIIVHSVHPPVSPTTIASILYDSGTTGLCTIQPTNSFSVGQIEAPLPEEIARRYQDLNLPLPPRVTLTRTVDFPVDSLVLLGGTEVVRVLSIAIGPDGVQSFRCFTFGTFAAGAAITGIASFRAYFNTTKLVGDPAAALAYSVTVTPGSATTPVVGGIQGPLTGAPRNWALVGNRALQPEDIIRLGFKCSLLGFVESVRLVLDASPVGPALLRDYYFYEWRASDLITAVQATGSAATGLIADAQEDAVRRGQTTDLYAGQYGQQTVRRGPRGILPNPERPPQTQVARFPQLGADPTAVVPEASPVTSGAGVSRQLAIGNDAWMTLECRVGDLTRVGSDTTLTLGALYNAAVYAQFLGTTSAINVQVSDVYLVGGYGPDVGLTLPPYVYRYSYRSTETGERSNLSPPTRAGVTPRRGRVRLEIQPSSTQADVIDIWRFGGALARWEYVGTRPNEPSLSPIVNSFDDDMADRQIDGGERPRPDWFQPWPTSDLPREGTCIVAGTAIQWVSGDLFDTDWAADSAIIVNGRATQLYRSPASATRLEVVDNCGAGSAVSFSLPSPTLLAQPLPALWGGAIQSVWFHFACGDPTNPGVLHWTHGNDPDATSDRNTLVVSSASEPLMNGYIDDGIPYVFSTQRLYRILPNFGGASDFLVAETNCSRGLWSRWFLAVDPEGGCYFGNKEGIWHTAGGADAVSIIDDDLRPLFPQDGAEAETIRNLKPVDFAVTTRLRLAVVGRYLYFDYADCDGGGSTLVYDRRDKVWISSDAYLESSASPPVATPVTVRLAEPGPQVYNHLLALADGNLYQYSYGKTTDVLADINWAYWTPWAHGEDPRAWKQWGDAVLDFNPGGSVNGVTVTPIVDNGNVALSARTLGMGGVLRDTFLVEVGVGGASGLGYGVISRNFGLWIEGAVQACDEQRPIFYLWEASALWKGISVAQRATDWDDLGYKGAKFVQGVIIRANTFGENKSIAVQFDGPNSAPQTALTLTLNHNGERTLAYPLAAAGWTPFIAELVRLKGTDDVDWALLDWRFIWEPAPELATQWETQYTTFDLPGFLHVHDGIVAYQSTADVSWFIEYQDGSTETRTLTNSGGNYRRIRQICAANKGKAVRFRWTSTAPFRLFKRDCSVRVQGWGTPGGYQVMAPFGGPHRADGAEI